MTTSASYFTDTDIWVRIQIIVYKAKGMSTWGKDYEFNWNINTVINSILHQGQNVVTAVLKPMGEAEHLNPTYLHGVTEQMKEHT